MTSVCHLLVCTFVKKQITYVSHNTLVLAYRIFETKYFLYWTTETIMMMFCVHYISLLLTPYNKKATSSISFFVCPIEVGAGTQCSPFFLAFWRRTPGAADLTDHDMKATCYSGYWVAVFSFMYKHIFNIEVQISRSLFGAPLTANWKCHCHL